MTEKIDIIVDIDGTLADIAHRRHFVASKPKNWPAFNRAMARDEPNEDVIWVVKSLWQNGANVLLASGRGDENRKVTEQWLRENGIHNIRDAHDHYDVQFAYEHLYMRPEKDYRADTLIKSEILDIMIAEGYNPVLAIDDRDSVCALWRARGLRCVQVDVGDF